MQPENETKANPTYDLTRQTFLFHRPKEYTERLLRNHILFLVLPSAVFLLALPLLFKAPVLFLVTVFMVPLLGLITFILYKTAVGTRLELSDYGLAFHEGVYTYTCIWSDLEALQEVRVGFTKIDGVQLRVRASMQTESWYENLEVIGAILSVFTASSTPSSGGSTYAKSGRFMPVGLFTSEEKGYDSQPWQIIRQQAPWLFDPTLRVARLKELAGTGGVFKTDLKKILANRTGKDAEQ